MELKERMKGVSIVQVTPFNSDGTLDLEGMRANTRFLVERIAGKDFILTPVGSTGEFYAMSPTELKAVIKMVVEEAKGKTTIMAGVAQAGTLETIRMAQYAQAVGADGIQTVLPYYHIPEEEGMYQHYAKLAESLNSNFGIIIYNNPDVSGSWIRPSLMKRLSKIPNIIAVKENTPHVLSYLAMRRTIDYADAVILCGLGEEMFSFEALYGCPGFVSSMANFAPELAYSVYEAAAARNFDRLVERIECLATYNSFIEKVSVNHGPPTNVPGVAVFTAGSMYIAVIKAAMDIIGLRGGNVRSPLVDLSEVERNELRDVLKNMKVI